MLLVITLLGLIPRIVHLAYPMQYDEAYTYMAFARPSLHTALTDYHLPNNHVLHSVLVHVATQLLGDAPWAIRLPAFLAGVACIPLVYLLGLRLYNRFTAVIAAALTAAWPVMITYSAEARGYSLVVAFSLGLFLVGERLLRGGGRIWWLALVLLGAAGAFTIPVMVYPLAALYLWLAFSMLTGEMDSAVTGPADVMDRASRCVNREMAAPPLAVRNGRLFHIRKAFLLRLAISAVCIAVLTLVLYAPILLVSGPSALFDNQFVRGLSWADYWPRVPNWLDTMWLVWRGGQGRLVDLAGLLVVLLAAVGTVLHRRVSRVRIPIQLAVLVVITPVALIQRPELSPRPWLFLVPLALLWAATGLAGLAGLIKSRWVRAAALGLALAVAVWMGYTQFTRSWPYWAGQRDRLELAGEYLAGQARAGDLFLVGFPIDPQIWYHLTRYSSDDPTLKYKGGEVTRAWAVVDGITGQSLTAVLAGREELPTCNTAEEMQLVEEVEEIAIYLCEAGGS